MSEPLNTEEVVLPHERSVEHVDFPISGRGSDFCCYLISLKLWYVA
jgi:hypothetical protein